MSSKKLDALIGTWQTEGEDSRAIIKISEKRGKLHVIVFDKTDGEKFKITKVKFQDGILSYDCYVPSVKYKTSHRLKPKSKKIIEQELTLTERWVRI